MKVCIIGSGNVATHLAKALWEAGHIITQVYSRTLSNAQLLADETDSTAIDRLDDINLFADVYIISVKDEVIFSIAEKLSLPGKMIVHTSGTVPVEVLGHSSEQYGVFYPLQTFSKNQSVSFVDIPVFLESNTEDAMNILKSLASISDQVYEADSEERKKVHLAAVLVNNFSNHLYHLADDFLRKNNIPFHILKPLIEETTRKVMDRTPAEAQTGPARRGDESTINAHLELLKNDPELYEIYKVLTKSIRNHS
jgi:predicted short-subunit dehydrogenase-like oxidoreductase (DUF2520 family)